MKPAPLHLRTSSDPAQLAPVRRKVEAFCLAAGFDDGAAGEIGLCLNEAMANVIRHAYRGQKRKPIEVTAKMSRGVLTISIRDWGTGIRPGPLPNHKVDPLHPGGLGLICLGRLMDKISFTPQEQGMLLEMSRRKNRREA
jgi:serine/threonine-protein kinase RsbW